MPPRRARSWRACEACSRAGAEATYAISRLFVPLDLVFIDYRLERDGALAKNNEAIRNAVDRLAVRSSPAIC